jgi:hypothetical protein
MVLADPSWGFTSEMKDDKGVMDALASLISKALISKHNTVKTLVCYHHLRVYSTHCCARLAIPLALNLPRAKLCVPMLSM